MLVRGLRLRLLRGLSRTLQGWSEIVQEQLTRTSETAAQAAESGEELAASSQTASLPVEQVETPPGEAGGPPAHWLARTRSAGPPAHWQQRVAQAGSDRPLDQPARPIVPSSALSQGESAVAPGDTRQAAPPPEPDSSVIAPSTPVVDAYPAKLRTNRTTFTGALKKLVEKTAQSVFRSRAASPPPDVGAVFNRTSFNAAKSAPPASREQPATPTPPARHKTMVSAASEAQAPTTGEIGPRYSPHTATQETRGEHQQPTPTRRALAGESPASVPQTPPAKTDRVESVTDRVEPATGRDKPIRLYLPRTPRPSLKQRMPSATQELASTPLPAAGPAGQAPGEPQNVSKLGDMRTPLDFHTSNDVPVFTGSQPSAGKIMPPNKRPATPPVRRLVLQHEPTPARFTAPAEEPLQGQDKRASLARSAPPSPGRFLSPGRYPPLGWDPSFGQSPSSGWQSAQEASPWPDLPPAPSPDLASGWGPEDSRRDSGAEAEDAEGIRRRWDRQRRLDEEQRRL